MTASPDQFAPLVSGCDLSIILPCYNAAPLIEQAVDALQAYLDTLPVSWEIVLVDDGSTDGTPEVLARVARPPRVRVVSLPQNRGKGRAVAVGMAQAQGQVRLFTDVDLPYRLDAIEECFDALTGGHHQAVFGNRRLAESVAETHLPLLRRTGSAVFRLAAGLVIGRDDLDTQCGFKGFSGALAERLFPLLTVDRFAFDVEVCVLLVEAGIAIHPIPVRLVNHKASTVTFGAGAQTLAEIGRIWLRKQLRRYDLSRLTQHGPSIS